MTEAKPTSPANHFGLGLALGVAGTLAGGVFFGLWWSWVNGSTFGYFYEVVVLGSALYRDSLLTAATLFNVILFYLANRAGADRVAMGLLAVILLTVPLIVYFQASAGTW